MDITQLKSIRNLQSNYMFKVSIPSIPIINGTQVLYKSGILFSVLIRGGDIPSLNKSYKNIRYLNSQVAIPFGDSHEGEIVWDIVMDDNHNIHDLLVQWYKSINSKNISGYSPFTDCYVELCDLRGNRTKIFRISNISPKSIPAINGLAYENIDGIVVLNCIFSYDNIDYDLKNIDVPEFTS